MSPYAKFGLDRPSRSAGHRPHTDKQTDKQTYMLDIRGGSLKRGRQMAIRHLSGNTTVNDLGHISRSLNCFTSNFSKMVVWYGKSYYRLLIGNHTLAFDWYHFWWLWSTFKGHFRLGCHFHVHFSNPWHAFASHSLPAIAEFLVIIPRHCVF